MLAVSEKRMHQQVLEILSVLTHEQRIQTLNFMKFLKSQETTSQEKSEDSFFTFITQDAASDVTLEQVREALSPIQGNLSDVIIQGREERA